jgi:hypothetical protein
VPLTLYSIRTHIDAAGASGYYITKFVDGEVESAYRTSREACECPAGVRPTCRHRQMLPHMLNAGIVNTHWFLTWPEAQVVDFQGTLRRNLEDLLGREDAAESAEETDLSDPVPTDADGYEIPEGDGNEEQDEPEPIEHPPGDYTATVGEAQALDDGKVLMKLENIQPAPAPAPFRRRI